MHVSVLLRPRSTTPKLCVIRANGLELYLTDIQTMNITGIAFGWNLGFLEAWCGPNVGLKSAQIRSCWQLQFLIPTKRRQSCKIVDYGFFALLHCGGRAGKGILKKLTLLRLTKRASKTGHACYAVGRDYSWTSSPLYKCSSHFLHHLMLVFFNGGFWSIVTAIDNDTLSHQSCYWMIPTFSLYEMYELARVVESGESTLLSFALGGTHVF